MALREITEPVELCLPSGKLNPSAVGFSRRPLHETNLQGWGRNKRWEYWGVISPTHIIGMTISDLDYCRVHQLYVYDRASGEEIIGNVLAVGSASTLLPDQRPPVDASMSAKKLSLRFCDSGTSTALNARSDRVQLDLVADASPESLSVVVPWSDNRFQYTVKDVSRPITGSVTIDGKRTNLEGGESWGVLDRGRGKWPYSLTWNWGAGSGIADGHHLGLQVGGKWTDGTGSTENAFFVDGHMTYWPEPVEWDYDKDDWNSPWRVAGANVDAVLTPFHVRDAVTNAGIIASATHQAFGVWSGEATDGQGSTYSLDGLVGWVEQAKNRW